MALLEKKVFAKKCGMTTGNLSNNHKRKLVVYEENGLIDDCNQTNIIFLVKHSGKVQQSIIDKPIPVKTKQIPREETFVQPDEYNFDDEDEEDSRDWSANNVGKSQEEKLFWQAKREKANTELLVQKKKKIEGTVIPSELIKPVFLQHNQCIVTAFKNESENILVELTKMCDLSTDQVSEFRGRLYNLINEGINDATKASLLSVRNIILNYSEK